MVRCAKAGSSTSSGLMPAASTRRPPRTHRDAICLKPIAAPTSHSQSGVDRAAPHHCVWHRQYRRLCRVLCSQHGAEEVRCAACPAFHARPTPADAAGDRHLPVHMCCWLSLSSRHRGAHCGAHCSVDESKPSACSGEGGGSFKHQGSVRVCTSGRLWARRLRSADRGAASDPRQHVQLAAVGHNGAVLR